MTSHETALRFEPGRRRARPRREWGRALRALRLLLRAPDRTELAFEVVQALDPDVHERQLELLLSRPEGRRIFAAGSSLRAALSDRQALQRLPEGSFGRAYLDHLERHGLDPVKLVELGRDRLGGNSPDPGVRWMAERSELTHDLWHVLSGYGADPLGEATLLLFSLAQAGGRGTAILALGANLRVLRERGVGWIPYAFAAWRRGRRAACLRALPYEELLPLPLDEVRAAVGLEAPERVHPGGVARGSPV